MQRVQRIIHTRLPRCMFRHIHPPPPSSLPPSRTYPSPITIHLCSGRNGVDRSVGKGVYRFARIYTWAIRWQHPKPDASPRTSSSPPSSTQASSPTYSHVSRAHAAAPLPLLFRPFPTSFHPYLSLARLDKPIGTWLLLWPCYWGVALATQGGHVFDWKYMVLFGVGAFVMRGAGYVANSATH